MSGLLLGFVYPLSKFESKYLNFQLYPFFEGEPGDLGFDGIKGQEGEMGPKGFRGYPGTHGMKGFKGETGPIGPTGMDGPKGRHGISGDPGLLGRPGMIIISMIFEIYKENFVQIMKFPSCSEINYRMTKSNETIHKTKCYELKEYFQCWERFFCKQNF